MSNIKTKVFLKPNPLDEAKTIGYMEGYSDGRNKTIEEFVLLNLLKRSWKRVYNKNSKSYPVK